MAMPLRRMEGLAVLGTVSERGGGLCDLHRLVELNEEGWDLLQE